jgi:hypothetical protein
MIEIKRVNDIDLAKKICLNHKVEWNDCLSVIATLEGGKALNSAVFSYDGETGKIYAVDGFEGDFSMLDGLCRAILNIMDINGVKYVYFTKECEDLAQNYSVEKENGEYKLSLSGFFKCSCKGT